MKLKLPFIQYILAFLIILPATLPLFRSQFFHMHDYTHVARLVEMDQALKDGHFPVRWSKNLGFGYGMPLFNFYAPLPYYFAEIIHLLGFNFIISIKLIFFLNFLISFLAMYYLARLFWGKPAALVAATAFIYAPYRAVDFYVRGSLSELTAITFIPLSLFCLTQLTRKRSLNWLAFSALALAAIPLSHNLIGFFSIPILFLISIVLAIASKKTNPLGSVFRIILSFVLAGGTAAFYILPAFFEKEFTQVNTLTQGFSNYNHHFLYLRQFLKSQWGYGGSIYGLEDDVSFEIGKLHILLAATAALAFFKAITKKKRQTVSLIAISVITIFFSMFMASFKSKFIWDTIPPLAFIQFPWRFLSLIIVFASLLTGASIWFFGPSSIKSKYVMACLFCAALILLNYQFFKPKSYLDNNDALFYTDQQRIQKDMSGVIPDYLPSGVHQIPDSPPPERFFFETHDVDNLDIQIDRTHEFLAKFTLFGPKTFQINIFYFPGWKLFLNGQEISPTINPDNATMSLTVSKGSHILSGKLTETPLRQASNLISAISLFIILMLLVKPKKYVAG